MASTGRASDQEGATARQPAGWLELGTSSRATIALLVAMAAYLCFHRLALPELVGMGALHDSGWVSWYTIALQAASLTLIAIQIPRAPSLRGRLALIVLSYIALIYMLREADFHRHFTDEHVTRGRFYLDASISLAQRLIAGVIVLPVFACLLGMAARYALPVLHALRARRPWAISLTLWGAILVGSQAVDEAGSGYTAMLIEEGFEATAAGLALLTVLHVRAQPALLLEYTQRRPPR
jgi:hypothetical protein